jgi:DNA invertase Pin-like site-specific DNA recombinase
MFVGYARVSTTDQTLHLQHDALTSAGCTKIFTDTASGAQTERKGLTEALAYVRAGDTLVDLISRITELNDRKIGFKSLTENIDTTTSGGKLIFHIFGALAEFERDIIRERTNAGLAAARVRGKRGGRPKALSPDKIKLARKFYADKNTSVSEICKMLGISRYTLRRYMKQIENQHQSNLLVHKLPFVHHSSAVNLSPKPISLSRVRF